MEASHALSYYDIDNDKYIEETILLANDILNNYEFGVNHYLAIRLLAIQYRRIGKQDEIIEKIKELPSIWESKTLLMPEVLKGEERIKAVQSNIYLLVDIFDSLLLSTYGREEVGKRDQILLKEKQLMDSIFENQDYGFYHSRLYYIYLKAAKDQAHIQNKEKVITYLNQAYMHAKAFDEMRFKNTSYQHTSFLVDRLVDKQEDLEFTVEKTKVEKLLDEMNDYIFAFMKTESSFKEFINQCHCFVKE